MKPNFFFLIICLNSLTAFAQEYCEVTYTNDVEPITLVSFAGIDNSSNPEINGTPGNEYFHEDDTLWGDFDAEETSPIILQGNTHGDHTDTFTVFIDWNENGDFTDEGEMYLAGSLINSTGTDGQQTITEISAPSTVFSGTKRMRVIKHRTSSENPEWPEDPCGTYQYRQAEDYTLMVTHNDPPPCSAIYYGENEDGLGNLQTVRYAADFSIDTFPENTVYVDKLYINIFGNISSANIYIYEDADGIPGALTATLENQISISQTWIDNVFGFNVYENIFEFEPIHLGNGSDVFWLAISTAAGSEGVPNFWATSSVTNDAIAYFSEDGGNIWTPDPNGLDGAFALWGICEEMNTQENSGLFDFSYYPNPVKDILKIRSDIKIETAEVYNAEGKQLTRTSNVKNGEISFHDLPPGIYLVRVKLKNGRVETFKIIKK